MLRSMSRFVHLMAIAAIALAGSLMIVDFAEARRGGGGFGSRGVRTYQTPAPTRTAPNNAAPIERSMTPNTGSPNTGSANQATRPAAAGNAAAAQNRGLFGGFGRSMLGGLVMGGLIGMLLGQGFGGMAGMLGLIVQIALIALIAMFAMRFFAARRQQTAAATASSHRSASPMGQEPKKADFASIFGGNTQREQHTPAAPFNREPVSATSASAVDDTPLEVTQGDLDRFEKMLEDVQSAYAREDYSALRALTTPEAMSYLAEELGEIASSGMRNSVSDVRLLQGDISEAWSEGETDYATVAMRYSSIDVMKDRNTGAVLEGDADAPTETIELWTFVRKNGGEWLVSAIQDAS